MSDPIPDSVPPNLPPGFYSLNCEDFIVDAVLDTTVRPLRPSLLKLALAERERLAQWQAQTKEAPRADNPPGESDPKNGSR